METHGLETELARLDEGQGDAALLDAELDGRAVARTRPGRDHLGVEAAADARVAPYGNPDLLPGEIVLTDLAHQLELLQGVDIDGNPVDRENPSQVLGTDRRPCKEDTRRREPGPPGGLDFPWGNCINGGSAAPEQP